MAILCEASRLLALLASLSLKSKTTTFHQHTDPISNDVIQQDTEGFVPVPLWDWIKTGKKTKKKEREKENSTHTCTHIHTTSVTSIINTGGQWTKQYFKVIHQFIGLNRMTSTPIN